MSNGFQTFRPVYVNENVYIDITIDGSGTIAAWTLEASVYTADGTEVAGAASVSITDADEREIEVALTAADLDLASDLTLVVRRTDSGSATVVKWGTVEVTDPTAPNAWGAGFY